MRWKCYKKTKYLDDHILKSEEIIIYRQKKRLRNIFIFLILLIMVIWSVDVTIVEDTDWERMGSLSDVLSSAGRFIGVDFSLFPDLIVPSIETFMISILGTFVGVIICIPATWFGAKNITPFKPLTYPLGRLLMTLSRSIHEIVWALFFVAVFGLGALSGICAIAVRSVGFIAKMSSEAIEDIDVGPIEAIRSAGGNGFQILIYAIIPQVIPQILGVIIFEWEINIRRSAILGLVGAGGLGLVFFRQMNTFNFHGVTSVIISILGIIVIGEFVSHKMRKRVI